MSVVIVGGNECMQRQYKELCREYRCKAKVYPKMAKGLNDIGMPDLLILFTDTVSHKMVRKALGQTRGKIRTVRSHASSMSALRGILEQHLEGKVERAYV